MNYCNNIARTLLLVWGFVLLMSPLSFIYAEEPTVSIQEQCFNTLKENLSEATIFETPLAELEGKSYTDIAPLFGEKKKMLQSFDLTIDQPILGMRLYSFGKQTGYTHPPKSVLPISTKSDTWGEPVKEYVLAEEYVTDPQGNDQFLDCVFLHIDSEAPMSVTEDRYAYDGDSIALLKTVADDSYKAWYNQAPGFDYDNNHFVTWKRMIVYPKGTENTYFSRYSVMDAYPALKTADFKALNFFLNKSVSFKTSEVGYPVATYTTTDASGQTKEVELPATLLPPDDVFNYSYNTDTYYQAIESLYPEFASLLSLQGALKFSTYKTLTTKTDITQDEMDFVSGMMGRNQELTDYYYATNKEPNPEFDRLIALYQNGEAGLAKLNAGETLADLKAPPVVATSPEPVPVTQPSSKTTFVLLVLVVALCLAALFYVFLAKKNDSIIQ